MKRRMLKIVIEKNKINSINQVFNLFHMIFFHNLGVKKFDNWLFCLIFFVETKHQIFNKNFIVNSENFNKYAQIIEKDMDIFFDLVIFFSEQHKGCIEATH